MVSLCKIWFPYSSAIRKNWHASQIKGAVSLIFSVNWKCEQSVRINRNLPRMAWSSAKSYCDSTYKLLKTPFGLVLTRKEGDYNENVCHKFSSLKVSFGKMLENLWCACSLGNIFSYFSHCSKATFLICETGSLSSQFEGSLHENLRESF